MNANEFRIIETQKLYDMLVKDIKENDIRIAQINFSNGLRIEIDSLLDCLKLTYNVINFSEIKEKLNKDKKAELTIYELVKMLAEIGVGLINPIIGMMTDIKEIAQLASKLYNKASEQDILTEKLEYTHKSKSKFSKIKRLIIIPDLNLISDLDFRYANYLIGLINHMFIVDSFLIITQSNEKLYKNITNTYSKSYDFLLNANMLESKNVEINADILTFVDKVGIEYLDDIVELMTSQNTNSPKVKDLINLLLKNVEYDSFDEDEIHAFLKRCSYLFYWFNQMDLEKISNLDIEKLASLIENTKTSHILKQASDHKRKYRFSLELFRNFYQENHNTLSEDEHQFIFKYLALNYTNQYTDLALASILLSNDEYEILGYVIKAYYHDRMTMMQQTKDELIHYMGNYAIGKLLINLNEALSYSKNDNMNKNFEMCKKLFSLLDNNRIDNETQLCCMYFICRTIYETEKYDFAMDLMDKYMAIYSEMNILSNRQPIYDEYVIDTIVFSTFTYFPNYTKAIQRLNILIKDEKLLSSVPYNKVMQYYRLGNLFHTAGTEGVKMTEKAYYLSEDDISKELAIINYSVSLIFTGEYQKAIEVMEESQMDLSCINPESKISYDNNNIIVKYLHGDYDNIKVFNRFKDLYYENRNEGSTDIAIVKNNYITSMLLYDYDNNKEEILKLCDEIVELKDDFHVFFAMMNKMLLYYFLHDEKEFYKTLKMLKVPELYDKLNEFFKAKFSIIKDCFEKNSNFQQLSYELKILSSRFEESKGFVTFLEPAVFGLIERWFE